MSEHDCDWIFVEEKVNFIPRVEHGITMSFTDNSLFSKRECRCGAIRWEYPRIITIKQRSPENMRKVFGDEGAKNHQHLWN